jgi:hypothetical protein
MLLLMRRGGMECGMGHGYSTGFGGSITIYSQEIQKNSMQEY